MSKKSIDTERMTQDQAAAEIGVTARTLRYWEDLDDHAFFPRNRDGTYSLKALFWYRVANEKR